MDCCDNKNIIFTDYYVCCNCGIIHEYKYKYGNSYYENNSNKNIISKSYYKRVKYLSKKLYRITNRTIIIFLSEELEEIKKYNNYNRIPINDYINNIYKYCERKKYRL